MAANQYDKKSVKELHDIENKVKKALVSAKEREKATIKQKVDTIVGNAGLSADEFAELYGFSRSRGARKGSKVAPKYRNPDNRTETWTGRGRQPRWLVAKLAKGGKIGDYTI